jgi:hypothetical protein
VWASAFPLTETGNGVADAVAAIRADRVVVLPGGHLHLDGAAWPCATNSELFVRDCYEPLYSSILGNLLSATGRTSLERRARRFIVAGQPGIGKSVLAWYILYRLLTEQPHRAVIHIDNNNRGYIILPGEPVRVCSVEHLDAVRYHHEISALNPVYVCDSFLPPTPAGPCVVLSSPGRLARERHRDSEVFKHYLPWLYVPVPSEAEVLQLRAVAFKNEPEKLVVDRMKLWGPNPRLALALTSYSEQQGAWASARNATLQELTLAAKSQFFGSSGGDKADAPHRFIVERCLGQDAPAGSPQSNMRNLAYWQRGAVVFASAPMAHYVVKRMASEQNWNAAFLVDATARISAPG